MFSVVFKYKLFSYCCMWTLFFISYVLLCFVLPLYVFPFMRNTISFTRLPQQLEDFAQRCAVEHTRPIDYIHAVLSYVLSQHKPSRRESVFSFFFAFETNIKKIFSRRGHIHTNHLLLLCYVLLAKAPFLRSEDMKISYSVVNLHIHPYIRVRIAGQWYPVDPLAVSRGKAVGSVLFGFS